MTEKYELPEELRLTRNLVSDFNKNEIIPLEQEIPHDSITIPEHDFLRLSQKTKEMGLWCLGVPEKHGGAHRHKNEQFQIVKKQIIEKLIDLKKIPIEDLIKVRNEKYLNITKI